MHKNEDPDFLNHPFSGQGRMTVKKTLEAILPPEIVLLNLDTKLDKVIAWNYKDQKRSNILDDLADTLNFNWQRIDQRILITSRQDIPSKIRLTNVSSTLDSTGLLKSKIEDNQSTEFKTVFTPSPRRAGVVLAKNNFSAWDSTLGFNANSIHQVNRPGSRQQTSTKDAPPPLDIDDELALMNTQTIRPLSSLTTANTNENKETAQVSRFEITKEDETLSVAFKRWSTQEGYQLIWDADKDFSAIQTIYLHDSIQDAVVHVMKDVENSDYPLHACIYKNKVLRIIPLTKVCDRNRGVDLE